MHLMKSLNKIYSLIIGPGKRTRIQKTMGLCILFGKRDSTYFSVDGVPEFIGSGFVGTNIFRISLKNELGW
jgi:hypothetical protein